MPAAIWPCLPHCSKFLSWLRHIRRSDMVLPQMIRWHSTRCGAGQIGWPDTSCMARCLPRHEHWNAVRQGLTARSVVAVAESPNNTCFRRVSECPKYLTPTNSQGPVALQMLAHPRAILINIEWYARLLCPWENTSSGNFSDWRDQHSRPSMQDSMTVPSTGPRLGSGAQNERRRNTEAAQWFAKHLRGRVPRARCAHNGGRGNSLIDLIFPGYEIEDAG